MKQKILQKATTLIENGAYDYIRYQTDFYYQDYKNLLERFENYTPVGDAAAYYDSFGKLLLEDGNRLSSSNLKSDRYALYFDFIKVMAELAAVIASQFPQEWNPVKAGSVLAKANLTPYAALNELFEYKKKGFFSNPNRVIPLGVEYLKNPQKGIPILGAQDRQKICLSLWKEDYKHDSFVDKIKDYFRPLTDHLQGTIAENLTALYTHLFYHPEIKPIWDVIETVSTNEALLNTQQDHFLLSASPQRAEQLIDALKNRLLRTWIVSGQQKQALKTGAKVILWIPGSTAGIYGIATIGAAAEGLLEEPEGDYFTEKETKEASEKIGLKIEHNLVEKPLQREEIRGLSHWKNIKLGTEANVTPLSIEQYDTMLELLQNRQNSNLALNTILYGPPGTGKTYHAITYALSVIANVDTAVIAQLEKFPAWKNAVGLFKDLPTKSKRQEYKSGRELLKDIFDYCCEQGQVVFTTFHQSMSYEDFIEGIKPKNEGGTLQYEIERGLFKRIADLAASNYQHVKAQNQNKLPFEEALQLLKDDWENSPDMKIALKMVGYEFTIQEFSERHLVFKKANRQDVHRLSINTLKELYYGVIEGDSSKGHWRYYYGILNKLNSYSATPQKGNQRKNFVIIIDEINRGNVSQIFGELITLIEDDKRLGKTEALELTLPYSKERFGVPPNLYIIGTMNTADRSVEALDTALRRRFSFVEMPPRPDLLGGEVEGIKLSDLLQKLNKRIEKLLSRDHQIGHSYFMQVYTIGDLKQVFHNKILPLLQEYFYGDYGKIGLVLGEGFFESASGRQQENLFANFFDYDGDMYNERVIYRLLNIGNMSDETFVAALRRGFF